MKLFPLKILQQGLVLKHVYILLILNFLLNMQAAIFHLSVYILFDSDLPVQLNFIKTIISFLEFRHNG